MQVQTDARTNTIKVLLCLLVPCYIYTGFTINIIRHKMTWYLQKTMLKANKQAVNRLERTYSDLVSELREHQFTYTCTL